MSSAGGVRDALTLIVGMEAREKENKSAQEWREKVFNNQEKWRMNAAAAAAAKTAREIFVQDRAFIQQGQVLKADQLEKVLKYGNRMGIGPSGTGNTNTSGSSKTNPVYTPEQGFQAVQAIRKSVGPMEELSSDEREFFNTIYDNPNEAAAIVEFVTEMREDGKKLPMRDLAKYINIYGVSKEAGNKEAVKSILNDMKDQLIDPNAKYDPMLFVNNFDQLHSYIAPVMNWGISDGAGMDLSDQKGEFDLSVRVMEAQLALEIEKLKAIPEGNLTERDKERIVYLDDIMQRSSLDENKPQNKLPLMQATQELFRLYGTFDKYSKNNPLFDPYRLESDNRKKREDAERDGTSTLPVQPAPNSSGEPFEPPTFENIQEFEESLRAVSREEFDKYNRYVIIGGSRIDNPNYTGEPIEGVSPQVISSPGEQQQQQPQQQQPQSQQLTEVPPEVERDLIEVSQAMQNEEMGYTEFVLIAEELQKKYPNGEFERLMSERLSMSSPNPVDFTFDKFIQIGKGRENVSN